MEENKFICYKKVHKSLLRLVDFEETVLMFANVHYVEVESKNIMTINVYSFAPWHQY